MLLEACLHLGLEAPATFADIQKGPTWSWEHTGGKHKRIDHVLLRPGPWDCKECSQAVDFDLANAQRDHMPLRAQVTLQAPRSRPPTTRPQICNATAVAQHGLQFWQEVRGPSGRSASASGQVRHLLRSYESWRQQLPKRKPLQARQPYISPNTLQLLHQLRDSRAQLRHLRRQHEALLAHRIFAAWRLKSAHGVSQVHWRHSSLHVAALSRHVELLARRVHTCAKEDKVYYFTLLLSKAANEWHSTGKPTEAIVHLRWASRRSAERRAVHAAGGYNIDAALEEQFRAQEGAQRVTEEQVKDSVNTWWQQQHPPCLAVMPTLSDAEFAVRRQAGRKAPGPDGIPNEIWKLFPTYSGMWFWRLCTCIALVCKEPLEFKRALVCALYKKGPAALPENYRSIALLNGMAKVWHGHVRRTIGQSVLSRYGPLQLGGRAGVPVSFAVAAFRAAIDLCRAEGRCYAALFVDIQAAYYEASRELIFRGDATGATPAESHLQHLAPLVHSLLEEGALALLGVPFPRVATVVLSTLRHLRFRVNLGAGKTEALLAITGNGAVAVRGALLSGPSTLALPTGDHLRLTPEYRYLGVIQTVRDNGRRDNELNAQRAQAAWAHARSMLTSPALPWPLKQAWVAGRVLPAAYATLSTCLAVSGRATAPLLGFFERAARVLVGSWQYGHVLTRPALLVLLGLCAPEHAVLVARTRLVVQLLAKAPPLVWELFDAAWNRGTEWCQLLADACRQVMALLPVCTQPSSRIPTLLSLRHFLPQIVQACRYLSRWGTGQAALVEVWHDVVRPRAKLILGAHGEFRCHMCSACLPSCHALAAHIHRKHSVVNCLTRYTNGTVCLWCHVDMHSTDRLKYHLRTTPTCLHGLRVTVGEAYVYGSGTKRTGRRGHVGLPPLRMIGPQNATPAQRAAALQHRECTPQELAQELYAAAAVHDVYQWPAVPPSAPVSPQGSEGRGVSVHVDVEPLPHSSGEGHLNAALHSGSQLSFCTIVTHSQAAAADRDDVHIASPLWSGLRGKAVAWRLPREWHMYWRLWLALHDNRPWEHRHKAAFAPLRKALLGASSSSREDAAQGPPSLLLDLLAATVTFRQICACVQQHGMLWIPGRPSSHGVALLRALLPDAVFRTLSLVSGTVFTAAHPRWTADSWLPSLSSICASNCGAVQPFALRAHFVYRTHSSAG